MYSNIQNQIDAVTLAAHFEHEEPTALLRWALEQFGRDVSLACSFGAEDMVLVDLLAKLDANARIFVLDTGRLHEETYAVMDAARRKYGIEFEVFFPETRSVQEMLRTKGPVSFYESIENRRQCCLVRKVEPLRRALEGQKAWITGLRREQAVTRTDLPKAEIDDTHDGILKLNPLADWSEEQVWSYIRANGVPYNELHDKGFPSIGCAPCTRAVLPGEDIRAGRWWWENPEHKECGLHVKEVVR